MTPNWQPVHPVVGCAMWLAFRQMLKGVGVGSTCTTDTYVMTECWVRVDGEWGAPLLRCESRGYAGDRDNWTHEYFIPQAADMDEEDDE